jgi:hypothetical protein
VDTHAHIYAYIQREPVYSIWRKLGKIAALVAKLEKEWALMQIKYEKVSGSWAISGVNALCVIQEIARLQEKAQEMTRNDAQTLFMRYVSAFSALGNKLAIVVAKKLEAA